jgi:hypothetical protein
MSAPKGNLFALGNRGGVGGPEKYRPEFAELARNACEAGATDFELGRLFSVTEKTINQWKLVHHEFSLALKVGKEVADDRVERSLYHRALGSEIERSRTITANGQTVTTTIIERLPGDTTAMIFWLKNRRPNRWRDRREVDPEPIPDQIDVRTLVYEQLTDEQLEAIAAIKQTVARLGLPEGDAAETATQTAPSRR